MPEEGDRPPASWNYYGLLFKLFGVSPWAARGGNVAVSVLALFPIFYLGRRFGDTDTGLWAAAIAAVYPNFVAYSHYLWPASIYLLFSALGLCLLVSFSGRPALWKAAVAGVVFGGSALTREMGIAFPPLATCWLIWFARRNLRQAIAAATVFVFACGLTILPWTIRISQRSDHFALLSHTTYLNLYIGNASDVQPTPGSPGMTPKRHYRRLGRTTSERELAARELALKAIGERMPWWPFQKLASEMPNFFTPNSFAVLRLSAGPETRLSKWAYSLRPGGLNTRTARVALILLTVGAYVLVAVAGVAGLVLARSGVLAILFTTFIASQFLPTAVAFACSRFRLGCMSLLIIGAAWVLCRGGAAWTRASSKRRIAAAVCATAMVLLISAKYYSVLGPHWG